MLQALPVAQGMVFDRLWGRFLRRSLWSLADFGIGYVLIGLAHPLSLVGAATLLGAAVAMWAAIVSLAVWMVRHGPPRLFGWIGNGALFGAFALALLARKYPAEAAEWALAAYWIPPAGWFNLGLVEWCWRGHWWAGIGLGAVAVAIAASLPMYLRPLRADYAVRLDEAEFVPDVTEEASPQEAEPPKSSGPTAIKDAILGRLFLEPRMARREQVLERVILRWLTDREKLLVEFLSAGSLGWTLRYRAALIIALVGFLIGWLLSHFEMQRLIVWGSGIIAAMLALPVLGGPWPGLERQVNFGIVSAYFFTLPIGFWELARVVVKVNWVRCAAFAPVAVGFGWLMAQEMGMPRADTVRMVMQSVSLLMVWQPLIFCMRVSQATNDGRMRAWGAVFIMSLLFQAGLVLAWILNGWSWSVYAWTGLLAGITSLAIFALYGFYYNRNRFDLMRLANSGDTM